METKKLPEQAIKLLTKQGFIERFYFHCSIMRPGEAYETTERQHVQITGERKYKNFESFKVVKNRLLKISKKR